MSELVLALLLAGGSADGQGRYGVGRPATPEEVTARDISVFPSGAGLPKGRGTAREGISIYQVRCAVCHGARGGGQGEYPPLAGGRRSLVSAKPLLTVGSYWPYATTVWDYIRRGMPYDHPDTLSADQVYEVTAFLLHLSGIIAEDELMDETTLPKVRMPNRDGFVPDPRRGQTATGDAHATSPRTKTPEKTAPRRRR